MNLSKVSVPPGKIGKWSIENFVVSQEDENFGKLRASISFSSRGRYVTAGTYTALKRNGSVIMSDTPDEGYDFYSLLYKAKDHVLINGLGLGWTLQEVAKKSEVTKVTVIEIDQDVIDLVGSHYKNMFGDKIEIICADALTWKSPKGIRYGAVWHDIWDNICEDNWEEIKKLHYKYGKRCDWQHSWSREEIQDMRRRRG